jgi:hypothetical protein
MKPLAPGEMPFPKIDKMAAISRAVILSASLGTLRRAGSHWYGPEKSAPFPARSVKALAAARLLYSADPNTARLTQRGRWCARTLCSAIEAPLVPNQETGGIPMAHRRLTEACIHALHEISHGPTAIHNRIVATNLRAIERVYPELIRINPAPAQRSQAIARPYFCAELTARGRAFITPRKLRKAAEARA